MAARTGPPATGTSRTATPRDAPSAAISSMVAGCTVLWIATTAPVAAFANTPSSPQSTARTWLSAGTQMPITSAFCATSRALWAGLAPPATTSRIAASSMS